MGSLSLSELSDKMADIDFCMLSTVSSGQLSSRPMSNNGDVEYDGDSYFFSYADTNKVRDIESERRVSLTFTAGKHMLGSPGIFIAIEGEASIIRDKAEFEEHWTADLERWFPDGADTPGVVLLKVHATRIMYWDGDDQGEVPVS